MCIIWTDTRYQKPHQFHLAQVRQHKAGNWKLVGVWRESRCSDLGVLTLGFLWTLRSLLLCIQQLFLLRWSINTLSLQPTRYFTFSFWSVTSFNSLLLLNLDSFCPPFSFLFLPPTPTVVPDQYSINLYSPLFNLFLVVVQVYNVITPSGALCEMNMDSDQTYVAAERVDVHGGSRHKHFPCCCLSGSHRCLLKFRDGNVN